jgi:ankyrin repeat protein
VQETEQQHPGYWALPAGRIALRRLANEALCYCKGRNPPAVTAVGQEMLRYLVEDCGVPVHAPLAADEEACLAPYAAELAEQGWMGEAMVRGTALTLAVGQACEEASLYLLSRPGVDAAVVSSVFSAEIERKSLLSWAVDPFRPAIVEALLERGADPLLLDPLGQTPLQKACCTANVALLRLLLSAAEQRTGRPARDLLADLELMDERGGRMPRFIFVFDKWEADTAAVLAFFRDELGFDLLRGHRVDWGTRGTGGMTKLTPLVGAVTACNASAVAWLVEQAGADIHEPDETRGWTALHLASAGGRRTGRGEDGVLAVVKYLVEQAGADATVTDVLGQTPAILAQAGGRTRVAAYLQAKEREQQRAKAAAAQAAAPQGVREEQAAAAAAAAAAALLEELAAEEAAAVEHAVRKKSKKQKKKKKGKGKKGDGHAEEAGAGAAEEVGSAAAADDAEAAAAAMGRPSLEEGEESEAGGGSGSVTAGGGGGGDDDEEEEAEDEEEWLLEGAPDDCLCPVSLVFLTEPVVAADGFTCAYVDWSIGIEGDGDA